MTRAGFYSLPGRLDDEPAIHARARVWTGPAPDELQRLLLAACRLKSRKDAAAAWQEWLERCRFDEQDPASFELAALAVARLGVAAGDGSEANRCRGWWRRTWFVSQLALEAAGRIDEACRKLGVEAVAVGDLASYLAGRSFGGELFAVRRVEIQTSRAAAPAIPALLQAAQQGPAGEAIRKGRLPVSIGPVRRPDNRDLGITEACASTDFSLAIPTAAARIVRLAAHNWRWAPPGQLRWMLELLAETEDCAAADLADRIVEAARREDLVASVREAVTCVASLPESSAIQPIRTVIAAAPRSIRSRLRVWIDLQPPGSRVRRLWRLREKWRSHR